MEERFAAFLHYQRQGIRHDINSVEASGAVAGMGRVIHYLPEQWPYLIRHLENVRSELSNNR